MPAKRSRIFKSPSFAEDAGGVYRVGARAGDPPERRGNARAPHGSGKPPSNSAKMLKVSPLPTVNGRMEQTQARILTLASPVQESKRGMDGASAERRMGNFLEKCYYCKKRMGEDHEVFMYSYLRAFCTSECRDRQMAMDKDLEKVSGIMTEHCKVSNGMNWFGS